MVHLEKIRGAWPSSAMPCKVRAAAYSSPLPALRIDVMMRALTKCGSPEILSRPIAITYGLRIVRYRSITDRNATMRTYDAAPVPFPPTSPFRIARSVGSSEGTTIPIHKAEPTKNTSSRQTKDLKAGGRILRGFSVSAATMLMYSGPVML